MTVDLDNMRLKRGQRVLIQFEPDTSMEEVAMYVRVYKADPEESVFVMPHPKMVELQTELFE